MRSAHAGLENSPHVIQFSGLHPTNHSFQLSHNLSGLWRNRSACMLPGTSNDVHPLVRLVLMEACGQKSRFILLCVTRPQSNEQFAENFQSNFVAGASPTSHQMIQPYAWWSCWWCVCVCVFLCVCTVCDFSQVSPQSLSPSAVCPSPLSPSLPLSLHRASALRRKLELCPAPVNITHTQPFTHTHTHTHTHILQTTCRKSACDAFSQAEMH